MQGFGALFEDVLGPGTGFAGFGDHLLQPNLGGLLDHFRLERL